MPSRSATDLRLLVACAGCARQYDASERPAGSRFHCACGEVLIVPRPRPHEAAVVRCSSCGAPRQGGAPACSFCGADFTLHERDLTTLCSRCMARISGRARFCHACATPVLVEGEAGRPTDHPCPACGEEHRLASRRLGERAVTALECGRCGGLWLGGGTFRLLAERARSEHLPPRDHGGPGGGEAARPPRQGPFYRNCPECRRLMHRQNYGRSSGVILDLCQEHGVWFDPRELEGVLAWIRRGGHQVEDRRRAEELAEAERRARLRPVEREILFPAPARERRGDLFATLAEVVAGAVGGLFRG